MSKEVIRIRYDGPALVGHSIDVNQLAPALLALGDLFSLANKKINHDRASVQVKIRADLENNCFEFGIELVQTVVEQVKSLIQLGEIKNAHDLAEYLGFIGTSLGLFKLIKYAKGKKIASKSIVKQAGRDIVEIKFEGDNNTINVYPETAALYEDPQSIREVQKIVKPLSQDGYESLEFEHGKKQIQKITKSEAMQILEIDADALEEVEREEPPQIIKAWVTVYSPVYDEKATKWRFLFGGKPESMDISGTDIQKIALQRGGALINDTYYVELEIIQILTKNGQYKNKYKIKSVLDFHPAQLSNQQKMF